nr:transport inhibitor response 1-like protein [Ipomoea batatas]
MSSPVTSSLLRDTRALPAFPNLKELVLVYCEEFGSSGLATVACECSRKLRVIECDVKDDEMDWISCFPETKTCVESLMFDCEVNFQALEQLVMNGHNVDGWSSTAYQSGYSSKFCMQVLDEGLKAVAATWLQEWKLESILYLCQKMSNAAVIAMSKKCPDLEAFSFIGKSMGLHRGQLEYKLEYFILI